MFSNELNGTKYGVIVYVKKHIFHDLGLTERGESASWGRGEGGGREK